MPNSIDFKLDAMSIGELKSLTSQDIKAMTTGTEITCHGQAIAVLLPYKSYLQIQKMILDAEAAIDALDKEFKQTVSQAQLAIEREKIRERSNQGHWDCSLSPMAL